MKIFNNSWHKARNSCRGEDAFILGNGPSIIQEDLSRLRGRITIGMNASTKLERDWGFEQTFYTVSDRRFLNHPEKRKWATSELKAGTTRVLRADLVDDDDLGLREKTLYTPHIKRDGWSHDLRSGFFYGCTTTMLAIQLAGHLGCGKIYLLGVDLRYTPESPRFYQEADPQVEDAFTSVQIWNISNARRELERKGTRLINCSRNSLLRPYLPFANFGEVLPSSVEVDGVSHATS